MFSRSSLLPVTALCGLAVCLPSGRACGPDFPNAYLVSSPEELAGLPTLSFPAELARLLPIGADPRPFGADTSETPHADEIAEVRAALAGKVSRRELETLLKNYQRENPPKQLDQEFQFYARGARAWHADRINEAVGAWRELLALPAGERHYRTVWAHFMVGRALWDTDDQTARTALQAAREAQTAGFADSEDLATASLGWEARILLAQKNYPEAMRLYFKQYAAGDTGAMMSLQMTLQQLFQENETGQLVSEDALRAVASDRQLRGIVSAWFVSRGGPHTPWTLRAAKQFRAWLKALPKTMDLEPAEADRWAWAAYQNALWDDARAFAAVAPADAPASEWVRSMLLLRSGDLPAAIEHLSGAARGFPLDAALASPFFSADDTRYENTREDHPLARLIGVRGVLALQRAQYRDALRLFLEAGHWIDVAYVAERVLTLAELQDFVRTEVPAPKTPMPGDQIKDHRPDPRINLRHLLARRLVRAGQFDRARDFMPAETLPTFDRFVGLVRDGYREENPRQLRALALWQAAQIMRNSGMEMQATELEPDYAIWGGGFEWPDFSAERLGGEARWDFSERSNPGNLSGVLATFRDEAERASQTKLPTRRFHYRQRASELAFLAATLLPDNDDLTATVLNTAGRWVAARYPDDAQIFYKTLVFRCPHTALGKAAAARHWLVPPPDS